MKYSRIEKISIAAVFILAMVLIGLTETEMKEDNKVLLAVGMVLCAAGFFWMALKSWRWNRKSNR